MQKLAIEGKLEAALKEQQKGSLLPAKYGKVDTTPLLVDVKPTKNDIPIEIKD